MDSYGTDKPDLRNPLMIEDASTVLANTTFKPFQKSTIKVIVVPDIGTNSNSWINEVVDFASSIGMPGIGYLTLLSDGSLKGPIDKFLSDEERQALIENFSMKEMCIRDRGEGDAISLSPKATKSGYTFLGWNTNCLLYTSRCV